MELLREAGLRDVVATSSRRRPRRELRGVVEPFTFGVGPAGQYVAGLDEDALAVLRERYHKLLPDAPPAVAWAARSVVPAS